NTAHRKALIVPSLERLCAHSVGASPMRRACSLATLDSMATATTLPTPLGRRVKVVEAGSGTPLVFLHSGVGSAGEWKQVFSLWPEGNRLVAIDAYRESDLGAPERRTLDDYADQVYA